MHKNFEAIDDYNFLEKQESIFSEIDSLVNMIGGDLSGFGNRARSLVETIFISVEEISFDGMLSDKINQLKDKYYIPMNVHGALYSIKTITNRESHKAIKKSEIKYDLSLNDHEANTVIRNIWLFMKWILIEVKGIQEASGLEYVQEKTRVVDIDPNKGNDDNSMLANKITLSQLIMNQGYQFNIPTYQRDYTWEVSNAKKLFDDLMDRVEDSKTHYFGSLAIAIDETKKIYRIIDGQQRISTSLLLLKALFDTLSDKGSNIPQDLNEFVDKRIQSIYINQEVLSSQVALSLILKGGIIDSSHNKKAFNNYIYFKEQLSHYEPDKIAEIFNTFAIKFEFAVLTFSTDIENEMDIFENLNTGGKKLEEWDLIRSFIFSKVPQDIFLDNEKEINMEVNTKILLPINIITSNKPDKLLKTFFTVLNRYDVIELNLGIDDYKASKVYENFKDLWTKRNGSKLSSFLDLQKKISRINRLLTIFLEIKHSTRSDKLKPYTHILSFISSRDDIMPLLMHGAQKYCKFNKEGKINKITDEFIKLIRVLESYMIKSAVYGNSMNSQFDKYTKNNIAGDLTNNLYSALQKFSIPFGSTDEFKTLIATSGSLRTNVIMSIVSHLELNARGIQLGQSSQAKFERSHEHIIAQKLNYKDYDDHAITQIEFETLLSQKKDSIGNALLLSINDNSAAGNMKFINKVPIYKRSSKASHSLNGIMNLTLKETFTFDDVDQRAKQISDYLIKNNIYYNED